jgi:hypothetical protein
VPASTGALNPALAASDVKRSNGTGKGTQRSGSRTSYSTSSRRPPGCRYPEVQRVRHEDAVERRQIEWTGEIGLARMDGRPGRVARQQIALARDGPCIAVDRVDDAFRPKQLAQCPGKIAGARPQVGPGASRFRHTGAYQRYHLGSIHRRPPRDAPGAVRPPTPAAYGS